MYYISKGDDNDSKLKELCQTDDGDWRAGSLDGNNYTEDGEKSRGASPLLCVALFNQGVPPGSGAPSALEAHLGHSSEVLNWVLN